MEVWSVEGGKSSLRLWHFFCENTCVSMCAVHLCVCKRQREREERKQKLTGGNVGHFITFVGVCVTVQVNSLAYLSLGSLCMYKTDSVCMYKGVSTQVYLICLCVFVSCALTLTGLHVSPLVEGRTSPQGLNTKCGSFKCNLFWCLHTHTQKHAQHVRKFTTLTAGLTEEENKDDREKQRETKAQRKRKKRRD